MSVCSRWRSWARASRATRSLTRAAICDIWDYNLNQVAARAKVRYGAPKTYNDIDEMLAKETDLDCVLIAVPDFLHHDYTRRCLTAGKAVYCEKMMSNTIERAADMVKAQRETGGILQIGHQRHSNPRYMNLRDNVIAKGLLGRVTHCYAQWNRGVSASAPYTSKFPVKADLLAKAGFDNMEQFLNWRYFSKYGGGPLSDLGAHQIDMFNWFFSSKDKQATPVSVIACGGTDYYDGKEGRPHFELADNVMAIYEFNTASGPLRCYYQVLTTTGSQGAYEKIMGVEGSAVINEPGTSNQVYREPNAPAWDQYAAGEGAALSKTPPAVVFNKFWEKPKPWTRPVKWLDEKKDARESKGLESFELAATLTRRPHSPHLQNFFEAARRKDHAHLTCPVDMAFRACVTVLKIYESINSGAKYVFKPEDFTA
jgi:predicted dehydrogenase